MITQHQSQHLSNHLSISTQQSDKIISEKQLQSIKLIKPLEEAIKLYSNVVFSKLDGFIPMRSFSERDNGKNCYPCNSWIRNDHHVIANIFGFATRAAKANMGCYAIPAVVNNAGEAKSDDIVSMQTLLIDIDDGNTEEKLSILEQYIGTPTLIVHSGGITPEGSSKLHIYWQLSEPTQTRGELQQLLKLRHQLAILVGGDTHFKSAHQPIRVAGSVYCKGRENKLVKIRSYNPKTYSLGELIDKVTIFTNEVSQKQHNLKLDYVINDDEFNLDNNKQNHQQKHNESQNHDNIIPINDVLTSKVHAGGSGEHTRFNHLTKVIGYWIRRYHEGLITREQAYSEIESYNLANVCPSWPQDKLHNTIYSLLKKHLKQYGKAKTAEIEVEGVGSESQDFKSINPVNWQNQVPPQRKWIIENWLPRSCVTALYGDGGVGKSLFAQQLMTALATGKSFLGMQTKPMRVYALMCEDDHNELWRRQEAINRYYGIKMSDLNNIRLNSRVGENNLLMNFSSNNSGKLTEFFQKLSNDIEKHKADLVILDTAADLFGGNENNRSQVRQFVQFACSNIAKNTDGGVLLCCHPSESGIQKGTGSGGSTAWSNSVRSRLYLKHDDSSNADINDRILTRVKSNYAPNKAAIALRWSDGVFISDNQIDSLSSYNSINNDNSDNNSDDSEPKQDYSDQHAKKDHKVQTILKLIDSEAAKGKLYTANGFANRFSKKYKLDSSRSIRARISNAINAGLIKLLSNPDKYGLTIKPSNYGYLHTSRTFSNMSNNTTIVNNGGYNE